MQGLLGLARSCGWFWPFEGVVILTERPNALNRDSENRLHCEDGPALRYPDGFSLWKWHGVTVPQDVIEKPSEITVTRIEAEQNAEVRRVMIDRYGPARYVVDSGARVVDEAAADHPLKGLRTARLLVKDVPGDEPIVYVDLLNSTPEPDGTVDEAWKLAESLPDATCAPNIDLAWCAGFFDGEGCTYVQPNGEMRHLAINIAQKDRPRIERFASHIPRGHWTTDKRQNCAFYVIHGKAALAALDLMWPYLSENKKQQAMTALKKICSHDTLTKKPHANGEGTHCGRGHSLEDGYENPKGGTECAICRKARRAGPQDEPFDWWRNPAAWIPGKVRPIEAAPWLRKAEPYSKRYQLRVSPHEYGGESARNVHAAAASTWRDADGSVTYKNWRDYCPVAES